MKQLTCSACNLPMQYQGKKDNDFVWQCFKCGIRYFDNSKSDDLIDID
ncbi:MAG TPA: hypothetical protein VD699_06625 [Nitrosopumilaceae archaeon]|nr:hypothetical protein [Nitrosopumilaceae archaeon]